MLPNQYHWDIAEVLSSESINSLLPLLGSLFSAIRVPIMGKLCSVPHDFSTRTEQIAV